MRDSTTKALDAPAGQSATRSVRVLDRLASFRFLYLAFLAFVLVDYFSIRAAERMLQGHFRRVVAEAIRVDPTRGPISSQIQEAIDEKVRRSAWVRVWGVRVSVLVLAADGVTPLYLGGRSIPPPPSADASQALRDAERLLPATADVSVSLTQEALLANVILVAYAAVLLAALFRYNRALARGEAERLAQAIAARDATAQRAAGIELELDAVRSRLAEIEPVEEDRSEAIAALERERAALQEKLADLARREASLRKVAARTTDLEAERRSLEEMLDEALRDVGRRDDEIQTLQAKLAGASKAAPNSGSRAREAEHLGKRLRTLYKNLEIDDRAIDELVGLRDIDMKLKAEEAMKRLSDEPDTAAVRRKVGGLPPHLSIFELGFAGKGRIYYTRGEVRRFRVLSIGAKNTQKADLEYLSRLP